MIACTPPTNICAGSPPAPLVTVAPPRCPKAGWVRLHGRRVRFVVDCHGTKP